VLRTAAYWRIVIMPNSSFVKSGCLLFSYSQLETDMLPEEEAENAKRNRKDTVRVR